MSSGTPQETPRRSIWRVLTNRVRIGPSLVGRWLSFTFTTVFDRAIMTAGSPGTVPGRHADLMTLRGMRKRIESVFETKVHDNYGANDGGVHSFECELNRKHICTERSLLEVVDDGNSPIVDEVGRILATDLENYPMPLLRYDLGDNAVASEDDCACGRGLPLLDSLIGGTVSIFVTPRGKLIHGWFFLYMFWEFGEGVRDYRVTQVNEHDIEILIVPGSDFDSSILTTINEFVHRNCDEWTVEITLVEEIPKTASGKRSFIESKVKRSRTG